MPRAPALQGPSLRATLGVLVATAVPTYACCEMAVGVLLALIGRMSLTGG
jgi:hypothetical protein